MNPPSAKGGLAVTRAAAAITRKQFSSTRAPGKTKAECDTPSKTFPEKPCNLAMLRLTEPEGDCAGKTTTRTVEIKKGKNGQRLAITATSKYGGPPRKVNITIASQAQCSAATHPLVAAQDSGGKLSMAAAQAELEFYRRGLPGDGKLSCGLWALLNAAFTWQPDVYPVYAGSCGIPKPAGSGSAALLHGTIAVYPADQYKAEIVIPAFLQPDALDFDATSKNWVSDFTVAEAKVKQAEKQGANLYISDAQFWRQWGHTKKDFQKFAADQKRRQLGVAEELPEEWQISVSQQDGTWTRTASADELITLLKMIRTAEYRTKQVSEWINKFQVGPGVGFKVSCQFLVLTLSASWGFTESASAAVIRNIGGEAALDLIKLELEFSFGFRAGGLADLIGYIKGAGQLGLTVSKFKFSGPDEPSIKATPHGSCTFSVGVEGSLLWAAKAEAKLDLTFEADTGRFNFFDKAGMMAGTVKIKRKKIKGTISFSCWLYGKTENSCEIGTEDPEMAKFTFP